ncbi:hypothetical protein [Streptomyces sp. NPDC049555]|uniref:hypothetical protein n=1 Tax=Streptomyces sp. NPDC049555 TaxID=3154930 RepID=UPI0034413D99
MRKLRNSAVVVGMAAAVLMGFAGSSSAAGAGGADAATYGADGSATWTYDSPTHLTIRTMTVSDTKEDGYNVYIRLLTRDRHDNLTAYSKRYNNKGVGTHESWWGLPASNNAGIAWATIEVCRGDGTCARGPWRENNYDGD